MYIITNRDKPLTPEMIVEELWPGQDYQDAGRVVKNLVHRLRKKIDYSGISNGSSAVINIHGCYRCNRNFNYWLDAEEFDQLCRDARNLAKSDPQQAINRLKQAIELYQGDYLPESPYSDWLMPVRHYYRQLFIQSASKLLKLLMVKKDYAGMLMVCEKVLTLEKHEEELHIFYIEALLGEKKYNRALKHYEYVSALLYREFGTKPSKALRKIYHSIIEQSEKTELQFDDLWNAIKENDYIEGALFCEPAVFRTLCLIEKRKAEREKKPVHIGLLTLINNNGADDPDQEQSCILLLKKVIASNLRKSDVYTGLNDEQCAIILSNTDEQQAKKVLLRIMAEFKDCLEDEIYLHYKITPLLAEQQHNSPLSLL